MLLLKRTLPTGVASPAYSFARRSNARTNRELIYGECHRALCAVDGLPGGAVRRYPLAGAPLLLVGKAASERTVTTWLSGKLATWLVGYMLADTVSVVENH